MNLWHRGTITNRQMRALDSLLIRLGRRRFNQYRKRAGIAPSTPNRRLSKQEAWLLMREITTDLEQQR
jgi:hypothetical protein